MRANKNGRLIPSYAQAGKTHLQHFQDFMQMSTQQALNDMHLHIDTVNLHNQIHMDANTNFMNNVDTFNAINSFYMY